VEVDTGTRRWSEESVALNRYPFITPDNVTTLPQLMEWSGGNEVELLLEEQRRILVEREKLRQMQEFDERERAIKYGCRRWGIDLLDYNIGNAEFEHIFGRQFWGSGGL
jgi:hypothetical protein